MINFYTNLIKEFSYGLIINISKYYIFLKNYNRIFNLSIFLLLMLNIVSCFIDESQTNFTDESQSLIIAEIGQNHDGSLGMAHLYIDACADIGVNAIKFQTHIASEESSFDDVFV